MSAISHPHSVQKEVYRAVRYQVQPISYPSWDHVARLAKNLRSVSTTTRTNLDGWRPNGNVIVSGWNGDRQNAFLIKVPGRATIRSAM